MRKPYSPELRSMNKNSTSFHNAGAYTSPGTPDYGDNNDRGFQKGWCSERVPLPNNNIKHRRASVNVLMPFNNGKTLPSKWDDAERWITSPMTMSGSEICKALAPPPQRRPKSKSGPLGLTLTPGDTSIFAGSPLTTGVLVPNGYSFHHGGVDGNNFSCVGSRRDMATQMSPVDSPESSPKGMWLLSTSPPLEPNIHLSSRVEVRDVQVDKRVTVTKQQRRHTKRTEKNGSTEVNDLALTWDPITESEMELSKLQKEEARITAWENLQNAKAEAAIRKLEMKLEKKKSESMEKIMNKLTIAQMKAKEMRKTMSENQAPRSTHNFRYPKISLTRCFVPITLKSGKSRVES